MSRGLPRFRFALPMFALVATSTAGANAFADDKPETPRATVAPSDPQAVDIQDLLRARMGGAPSSGAPDSNDPKRYRDFGDVTKGATKHEGLFTLHQKDDHLYAEIKPFQFDQPLYAPSMIARGMAMAGQPIDDDSILVFHRVGDRVQVIKRNVHYKAPAGTPLDKAVRQNYTDSVVMALPIVALNPAGGMSTVVDLADIYFTDFAQLGLGFLDRSRTSWFKVKAFPNNLELEVQATFSGGRVGGGDNGVADGRGVTMVIHYSLVRLPDPMYRSRPADERVGHFISAMKDFGNPDPETNFVRYINRWRLERSDPRAKLSPPKKQLVWWIEDTVPVEYRPYVEAGILEWNRAFEKIGFRNAIAVRWQSDRDDFDPEDVNYCTLRWITTNRTYAMSCFRANPLTGEILDGDVIFDAGWIKAWKRDYALLTGTPSIPGGQSRETAPLARAEVVSSILADKYGYGHLGSPANRAKFMTREHGMVEAIPADWSELQIGLQKRLAAGRANACMYSTGLQAEVAMAALVLAEAEQEKKPEAKKDDKPAAAGAAPTATTTPVATAPTEPRLPEEFLGQMIKEVVMHEVGHSLGLRHNFKASTMLTPEQINDVSVTRVKGQVGSVMDYAPVNLAPKGQKQGDYITQTLGPYDYWVIEYAYKEVLGDEAAELKKIAARSPEADLIFGSDEDRIFNNDPLTNTYDLSSDNCKYAKDRIELVESLLKDLDGKVVKDGEAWAKLRESFALLLNQYANATHLASNYVGGQYYVRDHKAEKGARDPIIPVAGDKQREALKFLVETVLSGKSFQFSPALLRRLGTERWMHWGVNMGGGVDVSINDRVLAVQRVALGHLLDADVLQRLLDQEFQADPSTKPLKAEEVFKAVSDGIWTEINGDLKGKTVKVDAFRRNLQRDHLKRLSTIVLGSGGANLSGLPFLMITGGGGYPADARALARLHLKQLLVKLEAASGANADDTTKAHLDECREAIKRVLGAGLDVREP